MTEEGVLVMHVFSHRYEKKNHKRDIKTSNPIRAYRSQSPTISQLLQTGSASNENEQNADAIAKQTLNPSNNESSNEFDNSVVVTQAANLNAQIKPATHRLQKKEKHRQQASKTFDFQFNQLKGGGQSLDKKQNQFFSTRLGHDFDKVRLHTGSMASKTAKSINARAYTLGNDIVFAEGEYQPESADGKRLLAHELTHVVQQSKSAKLIQRELALAPTTPDAPTVTLTDDEYEEAIAFNRLRLSNRNVFLIIEDLVGPVRNASDIDRAFIDRVLSIQADYGLTQDGKVGENTTNFFIRELRAEGRSDAGVVRQDLFDYLIRTYRSRAIGAMRRAVNLITTAGLAPPASSSVLAAYNTAFPGRTWSVDQPRLISQINAAISRLQGINIEIIRVASDLSEITNAADRTFISGILNLLPATNTPSFNTIVLFNRWVTQRNLRTTRLIHEAFHGISNLLVGGTIHHGPHPFDNAFAYQYLISQITGVNFNRAVVTSNI